MASSDKVKFHPIISSIQKIVLYETKSILYLVGSNNRETRFRLIEIDRRVDPDELKIYENPNEIDGKEIKKIVKSLNYSRAVCAYGILGFVRFLECYYLILVTKRTRCAVVGMHILYTVKDTIMVKICENSSQQPHPYEPRYLKMFNNVDLKSNFYFSYSYDLTHSLQYNMASPKFVGPNVNLDNDEPIPDWEKRYANSPDNEKINYAFRGMSRRRFVWNAFLLSPIEAKIHKDWTLEIIHGFISQSNISIFGRPVYVCLIARRSSRFAGTRFLKRGANDLGDVANEVETEQIVIDGKRMCSFVQMRGSIPSHWSQSKIMPKPPITLDLSDPYSQTSGKHFSRLLYHYGAPIIILNLVKKREKRRHESILTEEVTASIRYLNQFLAPAFRIKYIHFDMARKSRGVGNVMQSLAKIAEQVVQQTGLYIVDNEDVAYQTGIARVNCVDCLDRTNTAQFAIGKYALGYQLFKLGFLKDPDILFDSDCVTMLESIYEDHGDTLALQYGGSQLVHRIKTYRKTAAWTSQGNDIMQTFSRYCSNTFSDTEKQHSMNLFLGYYVPYQQESKQSAAIWELTTDYYMHNLQSLNKNTRPQPDDEPTASAGNPLTQWVSPLIVRNLPHSTSDQNKIVKELIRVHPSDDIDMIDYYSNYHLPFKFTSFEEDIIYQISNAARNFMPRYRTNFSPFQPGLHRRDERYTPKNPSLSGQSSTSSTTSSTSSSSDEENSSLSEEEAPMSTSRPSPSTDGAEIDVPHQMATMEQVYGTGIELPSGENYKKYKQYAIADKFKFRQVSNLMDKPLALNLDLEGVYSDVIAPTVDQRSIQIYKNYQIIDKTPDIAMLEKYLSFVK